MKYTLLDMVQNILSSMDSDEVNSISDTTESIQVANVIRTTYFDIVNRLNLPEHYSLVTLDASTNGDKPVLMYLPNTVSQIKWLKYNCATSEEPEINMRDLEYLSLEDFLHMCYQLNPSEDHVDSFQHTIGTDTFTILYTNNEAPRFYTTFDDNTVLFNSFDSDVDTTLQKSKTLACGRMVIPFSMSDSFIPDLDENQFPLLLNESKATAWLELKQTQHPKAEQNARRSWVRSQKDKVAIKGLSDLDRLPNFGRK